VTQRGQPDAHPSEITCLVAGCDEPASSRKPICPAHFRRLPGRTRSSLSLTTTFTGSPVHREVFARAAAWLEAHA
jgi:hypothetical protein